MNTINDEATARMRDLARTCFMAGVNAADPTLAVQHSLEAAPLAKVPAGGAWHVLAFGKAARAMAQGALDALPPLPMKALVVTNYENAADLSGADVMAAGHPIPDEAGARAAATVLDWARALGPDDRLLALVSGGASALLPAPSGGLTLADKEQVNRLLLAAGMDIRQMNLIRQHLSSIKGGGLLQAAAPARVTALIMSDVIGDDLRVIASGPTVGPLGGRAEAISLLHRFGLWQKLPHAVQAHLESPPPKATRHPPAENRLIGSNRQSLEAMDAAARIAGHDPKLAKAPLVGDVGDAAAQVIRTGDSGPGIYLFGGETTVTIRGSGKGGRNQEMALRVALLAEDAGWNGPWVFLSGGTDGRDGPTEAAGGLVDGGTLGRMRATGHEPAAMLATNDSNPALAASHDLLMTGPTGTNVADLQVLIRA